MWIDDYQWHYDYVRLAWDTGFSFEKCKFPNLDKNKICVVDVDRIVKERDVASVDRYIVTVVQYILDDEQAKVLDNNFVKIFRISQLAVEYLLFCKKYLDNTVVLLKKELTKNREENKELKTFIDDLQAHVETLTRQQAFPTFKCSLCSKVFSSEEYLNAHIKRRHNNQSTGSYNSETDKLNLEIKELKERLNNTEKLLKEKDEQSPEKKLLHLSNDNSNMTEVLDKFEKFKNQVDNEIKELKAQKSFYEENYGKLFNIVIQNKENIEPKDNIKNIPKTETTTQTDKLLRIENVKDKNVVEIQELIATGSEVKNEKVEVHVNKIVTSPTKQESLETRISTTLVGIEDQMQTFWNKLNELEQNKSNSNLHQDLSDDYVKDTVQITEIKPRAKPRSKFTQPTHMTSTANANTEKLQLAMEELEQQQKEEQLRNLDLLVNKNRRGPVKGNKPSNRDANFVSQKNVMEDSHSEENSYSESESTESESGSEVSVQNPNVLPKASKSHQKKAANMSQATYVKTLDYDLDSPKQKKKTVAKQLLLTNLGKQSHSRTRKKPSSKVITSTNKVIGEMVGSRLQELGISENWTLLPERSFKKALEIINHQAALTKKTYPNFNSLKKKINADIDKQCNRKTNNKTQLEIGSNTPKLEKLQNIVKVSYRPKSGKKDADQGNSPPRAKRETVQIKNRALYDTDTESEQNFKQSRKKIITAASITDSHPWYSSVVNELKSLPNVKSQTDEDSMDEINKNAQKGVLKSYPSIGSLSKKKVLFDLESESSKIEDAQLVLKAGGSTTSIASSILGDKVDATKDEGNDKEKSNIKNVEKELDDLSDFDFSDL